MTKTFVALREEQFGKSEIVGVHNNLDDAKESVIDHVAELARNRQDAVKQVLFEVSCAWHIECWMEYAQHGQNKSEKIPDGDLFVSDQDLEKLVLTKYKDLK